MSKSNAQTHQRDIKQMEINCNIPDMSQQFSYAENCEFNHVL